MLVSFFSKSTKFNNNEFLEIVNYYLIYVNSYSRTHFKVIIMNYIGCSTASFSPSGRLIILMLLGTC